MLTPEQKAEIARANGAKSRGPVTDEGKERSSRNALKSGEHAVRFRHLLPPHAVVLCNEDRAMFYDIFDTLLKTYRPPCPVSAHIVREIAYAQWEISRNNSQKTALWNTELMRQAAQPQNVAPELHELEATNAATRVLYGPGGIIPKLNTEIHRLTQHIIRLEKRLRFLTANFPTFAPTAETSAEERAFFLDPDPDGSSETTQKRTDDFSSQPIENTEFEPEDTAPSAAPSAPIASEWRLSMQTCRHNSGKRPASKTNQPARTAVLDFHPSKYLLKDSNYATRKFFGQPGGKGRRGVPGLL